MDKRRNRRAMTARVRENRLLLILQMRDGELTGHGPYFRYRQNLTEPGGRKVTVTGAA